MIDAIGYKIIIPGLTFLSVITIGTAVLIIKRQRSKALEDRLQKDSWKRTETGEYRKKKSGLLQLLEKIGNFASHGHTSTELWEELVRAGYYSSAAPSIYTGMKMLLFVIGLVCTGLLVIPMEVYVIINNAVHTSPITKSNIFIPV